VPRSLLCYPSRGHLRAIKYELGAANADAIQKTPATFCRAQLRYSSSASDLKLVYQATSTRREEAREAVAALTVFQTSNTEPRRAMLHSRDQIYDFLSDTWDELNDHSFEEIHKINYGCRPRKGMSGPLSFSSNRPLLCKVTTS